MRRIASRPSLPALVLIALLPLVAGCEQIAELLELPNPARDAARMEAEGRAIGSACRHAGRSLEDCYTLNASADKASVFAGWRDMNDYMMDRKLEVVPSRFTQLPTAAVTPLPAEASTAGDAPSPGTVR
ncbi:hypothetical protein [Thauera sp. WH-1]|uniref:hypothetical protein n=1 Tax=Thauera sp. WH-1 TaxID=3398230 RepID=UPI0039FCE241